MQKHQLIEMEITPQIIAGFINGKVEGKGDARLTGFAKIEEAEPGNLCFIANPKYSHYLYSTKASAVLIADDFVVDKAVEPTLIRVKDPYSALATLMNMVSEMQPKPKGIESPVHIGDNSTLQEPVYLGAFSYIGNNCEVGKNCLIYPQSYIGDNVKIGDNTIIYAGVKIYKDSVIGCNCILHSGAVIGADGFGFAPTEDGSYKKIPQIGKVIIEDDVEIGANTTVDRATFGCTRIKKGTKLDNLIQIAHNVEVGERNVFAAQVGVAGSTKIGDDNQIGGQVGFAGHISVGSRNQIGAQSGIPSNVGDDKRIIGSPAVDFGLYAKTQVYLKRLGELFQKKK